MTFVHALTPLVEALEKLGIPYLVDGSVASSVHGVPRSTFAVDVVAALREQHLAPLWAALGGAYGDDQEPLRRAIGKRSLVNLLHAATGYKVDLLVGSDSSYDSGALQRGVQRQLEGEPAGRTFCVATPEDFLLRKLQWFRAGGEVSERQWQDIVGVLQVQKDAIDDHYLHQWANELQVDDLLVQAERAVLG